MKNSGKISESELEVMEVLWENKDGLDIATVLSLLPKDKKWAYNTVGTFMIRLAEKGYLTAQKRGRSNVYRPTLTKEAYLQQETDAFLNSIHHGSKKSLLAALYQDKISEEKIDKLLSWLEEK